MASRIRAVVRWFLTSANPSRAGMPRDLRQAASRIALLTHQPRPTSSVLLALMLAAVRRNV